MRTISNKRAQLVELFNWLDYRGLNRVDTLHIFATILLAIEGNPETVSQSKYIYVSVPLLILILVLDL